MFSWESLLAFSNWGLPFLSSLLDRNLEEMERDQKKKKRGRRDEDFYYNDIQQPAKKHDTEHYGNSIRVKSEDGSKDDGDFYISSENNVALGVFDFPWMREGIVSKSEDWDSLEDSFSSSLEDTCFRSRIKFSDCLYESSPASPVRNFYDDKRVFKERDDGHGLELEMDCIWGSLLNQPLQQGGCES